VEVARKATVKRKTRETDINLLLNIDGKGDAKVFTGVGFLDHMLTLLSRHGGFDLDVKAAGDTNVDYHHTVEDVGIALGQALKEALGDKSGIERYGWAMVPMDESLARVAVDLGGRPYLVFKAEFPSEKSGEFDAALVEEFMQALANNAAINLHIDVPYGRNTHHISEAIFKALARALRQAVKVTGGGIPSTKGTL
jgi:imidazoleglycerol-phosphate dehydratase